MSLVHDAISTTPELNKVTHFSKNRFTSNVLQEIVQDTNSLDEIEIVSIIFLFTDKNTNFSETIQFLQNDPSTKLKELQHCINWGEKLLECLIIIGNIKVIKKLGFNNNEIKAMKERFVYNVHNVSENLNRVIKSLYFVCENLDKREVEKLVNKVNERLGIPIKLDKNKLWLELYILHLLQQKYISIDDDDSNVNNLIQDLKSIGCLIDLPFNFEHWKTFNKNQQDLSYTLKNDNSLPFPSNNCCIQNDNNLKKIKIPWERKNKKLCIIINQINFKDNMYRTRLGSDVDEKNLVKTFRGCNFEIDKPKINLTKKEMIDFLKSFNIKSYAEYACIFMCILSHGSDGEVVFSDNEKISIETIKDKFCCQNLQNVFKFIILQSCQGTQIGLVDKKSLKSRRKLVTDGPTCPVDYKHFGLFQATISRFAALRDETEGSWFIQDVCTELRISTPILVTKWVTNVTRRLSERKATCNYYLEERDVVQIPHFSGTIPEDYEIPKYQELLN